MTNAKCVIDIMKNKEYIEVKRIEKYSQEIDVFTIKSKNIYNKKVANEIVRTVEKEIKKSDEYIVAVTYRDDSISFAKKEDVINFVECFISCKVEYREYKGMPHGIRAWINREYPNINVKGSDTVTYVRDISKEMERKRKEKEHDEEALKLLNDIL